MLTQSSYCSFISELETSIQDMVLGYRTTYKLSRSEVIIDVMLKRTKWMPLLTVREGYRNSWRPHAPSTLTRWAVTSCVKRNPSGVLITHKWQQYMTYSFVSSVKANTSPIFTRPTSETRLLAFRTDRLFVCSPLKTTWRRDSWEEVGGEDRQTHTHYIY